MSEQPCILIMAGGTGGHVFPALAIAQLLQENNIKVEWLGTSLGIEAQVVPRANIPLHYLTVSGLRGKGVLKIITAPFQLLRAMWQSWRILRQVKPDAVIGMGGYVSGPGGLVALLTRTPLMIHEQNTIKGLTNRILSYFATRVMSAFPDTFSPRVKPLVTGNPVRADISQVPLPEHRFAARKGPLQVLVLGGSQGAQFINQLMVDVSSILASRQLITIWHQTGDKYFQETEQKYQDAKITGRFSPFIADMAAAYAWADIVICRAGALTIAELSAVGVGSCLIPYPFAVDDHQTHNARYLSDADAAFLFPQSELTTEILVDLLCQLAADRPRLLAMANAARALGHPQASEQVVSICREICSANQ